MENQNATEELLNLVKSLQSQITELQSKVKTKEKIGPKPKRKYTKKTTPKPKTEESFLEEAEPVVRKVGFKKNLFKDTGELCKEDGEFDKKIKYKRTPRTRPPAKQVTNTCSSCNKQYKSYVKELSHWRCSRCVKT